MQSSETIYENFSDLLISKLVITKFQIINLHPSKKTYFENSYIVK